MTQFGYTAMGEQVPAKQLVTDLVAAERAAELLPALRALARIAYA